METKITLRDIFAYFLVGFYFLGCLSISHHKVVLFCFWSHYGIMKNIFALSGVALILIPFIYLLGVIIQGIDNIVFDITLEQFKSNLILKEENEKEENKKEEKYKNKTLARILGYMVIQNLPRKASEDLSGIYTHRKEEYLYWKVTLQSTSGLFRVSWIFILYSIITFSPLAIFYLMLAVIFWYRGKVITREIGDVHNE